MDLQLVVFYMVYMLVYKLILISAISKPLGILKIRNFLTLFWFASCYEVSFFLAR